MSARNSVKVVLPSAARTATTSSDVQDNPYHNSAYIVIDATAETATASVVPTIEAYDPVSGKYFVIATMAAVDSVATRAYYVGAKLDGAEADGAGLTSSHNLPLPRKWRITMTAADADSLTYSVSVMYLNS